eukprot:289546_1
MFCSLCSVQPSSHSAYCSYTSFRIGSIALNYTPRIIIICTVNRINIHRYVPCVVRPQRYLKYCSGLACYSMQCGRIVSILWCFIRVISPSFGRVSRLFG